MSRFLKDRSAFRPPGRRQPPESPDLESCWAVTQRGGDPDSRTDQADANYHRARPCRKRPCSARLPNAAVSLCQKRAQLGTNTLAMRKNHAPRRPGPRCRPVKGCDLLSPPEQLRRKIRECRCTKNWPQAAGGHSTSFSACRLAVLLTTDKTFTRAGPVDDLILARDLCARNARRA